MTENLQVLMIVLTILREPFEAYTEQKQFPRERNHSRFLQKSQNC